MVEASFLQHVKSASAVNKINSAIFFGPSGTGKTWLAASATEIADYAPVLIVDIEGSAAGVGRQYPDVHIVEANTHEKLELVVKELLEKEHPYKTVIFDTLNVAQNRAFKAFEEKAENQNNSFGAWRNLKDWTVDFVRKLHHAPFLAIFIAHDEVDKDQNTGKMSISLALDGQAKKLVPPVVDLIGYLQFVSDENGKPVRALQVGRHTTIVTKNRFGIPDVIFPSGNAEGPTIGDIQREIILAQEAEE